VSDLFLHRSVVALQEIDPFREIARAAEFGVPAHVGDGHARVAQAAQDAEPGEIVGGETTVAAGGAVDVGEEADAFVVARRVEAEAGLLGGLGWSEGRGVVFTRPILPAASRGSA
jgi:hypothetical protein